MDSSTHPTSVGFTWAEEDFDALKRSCDLDPATAYILRYMPQHGRVIEAGCGLGRFVAYLSEMGYDVEGIEINPETVRIVKRRQPSLQIRQGDVASMPYPDNSVAGVISLGVVEHFVDGPELPLREIQRILRPGAYAVLTIPSLNHIRRLKRACGYYVLRARLARIGVLRRLLGKDLLEEQPRERSAYRFMPHLVSGRFFEYWFTKSEFERLLTQAGFDIIESVPIGGMDGIYHEFGRALVRFADWQFHPTATAEILNGMLTRVPFCHNHMHLCVVRK